ncbi:hypothetical protein JTB14_026862 [Gonioctena quinquepunctata]|nr:hypothetical protein JTB14_026862 [Gonioctena quinquepunctata]
MRYKTYEAKLTCAQRSALIRVASAYWTVSTAALQVIASAVPVHLLVAKRVTVYERGDGHQEASRTNYYFMQFLSQHGSFKSYTRRIRKNGNVECMYCEGNTENAEHTEFRFERNGGEAEYGHHHIFLEVVTGSEGNFKVVLTICKMMREKKEVERLA